MAKVPSLPSNGQPIDTQYLYDIVSSLISINGELTSTGTSQVQSYTNQPTTTKTNNIKFQARIVNVLNSANVSAKSPTTGQISFNTQFGQSPIATATLVTRNSSTVKPTLTITGIDTSAIYYKIDYNKDGVVTLDISVIAIGV
ncbi:MAG: hypothetical protein EBT86_13435 [Actinobacteria bacterium]|nr:hypothetical protein [Actinomycetota bacterium]